MGTGGRRPSDPRAAAVLARFTAAFGDTTQPIPGDRIACDLMGLRIELSHEIEVSGLLIPETMRVYVNAKEAAESEGRRRFTIAHEIGHWVCQCDEGRVPPPEPIMCRDADLDDGVNKERETEANNFAASLLMPEPAVRAAAAEGLDHEQAAERFVVSDVAMRWRYYNLGINT